jgi:hypothetical protein
MKPILLFGWSDYPKGGWADFIGSYDSFSDMETAAAKIKASTDIYNFQVSIPETNEFFPLKLR